MIYTKNQLNGPTRREKAAKLAKQGRGKRKKNLGLLSFGEEAGEEDAEGEINAPRIRSAFDADIQDER